MFWGSHGWSRLTPLGPQASALRQPQELIDYLGKRNIAIFSADMDSFDFKMRKPEQVRQSVMEKLKKHGKGIVLLHDFQHATGYKIVFMQPKFAVTTIATYDETILKRVKVRGAVTPAPPRASCARSASSGLRKYSR
jgi:hypothetical protein